jgi:hypothetical protein
MEFIGLLFYIFFIVGCSSILITIIIIGLGVIGIINFIPEEYTPIVKPTFGIILIVLSLAALISM